MPENFEILETGQIEIMHGQVHDRLNTDGANCDDLRAQHDQLAAELVKRGISHDTEVICPESELAQKAPNYRRGFTDDICVHCAFGQLFPFCNLYKSDYTKDFVCDSFQHFDIFELEPPHGFLIAKGKQTAIATDTPLDYEKAKIIVSDGEVFGVAELDQPSQIKSKEFDLSEWVIQHRITPRERRQWWPEAEKFYIYPIKNWSAYDGVKLYEDGKIIDEPKLTAAQWDIVSTAKQLPKQITLIDDVIAVTDRKTFAFDNAIDAQAAEPMLKAAYDLDKITKEEGVNEFLPLYSLALVRNPRMRVSKKNLQVESEYMPYKIVESDEKNAFRFYVIENGTKGHGHFTQEYAHFLLNVISAKGDESPLRKIEKYGPHRNSDQLRYFILAQFGKDKDVSVKNIFDRFLVVHKGSKFFRVNYAVENDNVDVINFAPKAQWVEVDEHYHPAGCEYHFTSYGSGLNGIKEFSQGKFAEHKIEIAKFWKRQKAIDTKRKQDAETKQEEGEDMPFAVRLMEGEYCVVNTDTEETMGCHETEAEAEAQLAALRINVEADENAMDRDKPKKRKPRKKEAETPKKVGFMDGLRNLSKSISDFLKSAEIEENETDVTDFFASDTGISQKQVNGELWHFTWSTNAFEDREGEIFSTKSLENYVSQAEKLEDRGHFNFWHINAEDGNFNTDFAKKEWQGVIGRFLVEAGPYLDNEKGQAAKEFFNQYPNGHPKIAPEGWGCSPEYKYLPEERVTGVYENIWITRTSTLPLMRAANIWTKSSQLARSKMALTEDQLGAAIELFGGEDKVRSLIAEAEKRTEELEESNIAHKENTATGEEPAQVELDLSTLAAEVGKQFSANLEPMAEALTALSEDMKAVKDRIEALEGKKEIIDRVESPRYVFTMRASESDETIVTEDNELKSKKTG